MIEAMIFRVLAWFGVNMYHITPMQERQCSYRLLRLSYYKSGGYYLCCDDKVRHFNAHEVESFFFLGNDTWYNGYGYQKQGRNLYYEAYRAVYVVV